MRITGCLAILATCERGAALTVELGVLPNPYNEFGAQLEFVVVTICVEVPFGRLTMKLGWTEGVGATYGLSPELAKATIPRPSRVPAMTANTDPTDRMDMHYHGPGN